MSREDAAGTVSSVLLVGPEQNMRSVADDGRGGQSESLRFDHVPGLGAARSLLASGSRDCVVVDDGLLADDGGQFVDDVHAFAPGCAVLVLTGRGSDGPSEELVSKATTIVEESAAGDNSFLLEKIRSTVRSADPVTDEHQMYRTLVESARDGLYRLDAKGQIVYANESFAELLGYDRTELLGSHGSRAMTDGELERGQRVVQQVLADDDRESDIMDMEMVTKAGDRIVLAVHFVVLTTDEGTYDGVTGVVRDVTERRERERKLEETNERLDSFASMVSHDLRNPLNVAEGRLALVRETVEHEDLDDIAAALDRMDGLIDDLLTLARDGKRIDELEPVALESAAENCWRNLATPKATLAVESTLTLSADRTRVKQLLENLLRNALDHGRDDVHVVVGDLDDDNGFYVADDGPGIPAGTREDVFDAGYSTDGDGTGFGLAIVEDVADAHGWSVAVTESETGGARFEVTTTGSGSTDLNHSERSFS